MKRILCMILCCVIVACLSLTCYCANEQMGDDVVYIEQNINELLEVMSEFCDCSFDPSTYEITMSNFKEEKKVTMEGYTWYQTSFTGEKIYPNTSGKSVCEPYEIGEGPSLSYGNPMGGAYGTIAYLNFESEYTGTEVVKIGIIYVGTSIEYDSEIENYYNNYCTYENPTPSITSVILGTMVTSITTIAVGLGNGVSSLVTSAMFTDGNLSNFGYCTFIMVGVCVGVGLTYFVMRWLMTLGKVKCRKERSKDEEDDG